MVRGWQSEPVRLMKVVLFFQLEKLEINRLEGQPTHMVSYFLAKTFTGVVITC